MVGLMYNAKNVYSCCGIRLLPGFNEVEDGLLKTALNVPLFKWRIEQGIIQIIKSEKQKAGRKSYDQMIELMPKVFDVKLLKRYIKENKNEKLVQAAEKQLEKIKNVPVIEVEEVNIGNA